MDLNDERFGDNQYWRDLEYGAGGVEIVGDSIQSCFSKEENFKEECIDMEQKIFKDVEHLEYLSKKEKKAFKRIISKRINSLIATMKDDCRGLTHFDINEEVDDELEKIREAVLELTDIEGYISCSQPKINYKIYTSTYKKPENNYSKDMEEVDSTDVLKIKLDKKSLDAFLSESDGDLENIGMITADNREFEDVEKMVFKVLKVGGENKTRKGAYTEADGKVISDYAREHGLIKCGWIHTHPFTKNSTFFSGLDETTTKEMCVLPDDYCLAVVVGCEYKDKENYMEDAETVVKKFTIGWNLGKMVWRKQESKTEFYDSMSDEIKARPKLSMIKYECEIVLVDELGGEINDTEKYSQTI